MSECLGWNLELAWDLTDTDRELFRQAIYFIDRAIQENFSTVNWHTLLERMNRWLELSDQLDDDGKGLLGGINVKFEAQFPKLVLNQWALFQGLFDIWSRKELYKVQSALIETTDGVKELVLHLLGYSREVKQNESTPNVFVIQEIPAINMVCSPHAVKIFSKNDQWEFIEDNDIWKNIRSLQWRICSIIWDCVCLEV